MKQLFITMLFVAVLLTASATAQDTLTVKESVRNLDARVVQLESLTAYLQVQVKELQVKVDSLQQLVPKDTKDTQRTGKETCKGITKKGKRCSRTVTDGTGYCWQHKK